MDKYDLAVAYFTEHPEEITMAWGSPACHAHGILFGYTGKYPMNLNAGYGCLTTIKGQNKHEFPWGQIAPTRELTAAIIADDRIPKDRNSITVDSLPVFAEWHRKLDKELGRE